MLWMSLLWVLGCIMGVNMGLNNLLYGLFFKIRLVNFAIIESIFKYVLILLVILWLLIRYYNRHYLDGLMIF